MSEEKIIKDEKNEIAGGAATAAPVVEDGAVGGDRKRAGAKPKRRICPFCANKTYIDYKDVGRLRKYVTENGKITPRRQTGLCANHQREITNAIKRAKNMSLL
jgi:small subunit ribosomal protein S18